MADEKKDDLKKCDFVDERNIAVYERFDEFVDIVFRQGKQIDWKKSIKEKHLTYSTDSFDELLKTDNYKFLLASQTEDKFLREAEQEKELTNQSSDIQAKTKQLMSHLNYIWSLPNSKMQTSLWKYDDNKNTDSRELFLTSGVGSYGMSISKCKPFDMFYIIEMIKTIRETVHEHEEKTIKEIKEKIVEYCLTEEKWKNPSNIRYAFLHLCDPENYSSIFTKDNRNNILKYFKNDDNAKDIKKESESLKSINDKLKESFIGKGKLMSDEEYKKLSGLFYDPRIRPLWDTDIDKNTKDIPEVSKLEFKKSLILYGPPGTSKTYTAKQLADALLIKALFQQNKLANFSNERKTHIHRLQLHPNYTYEDFMWGYEITSDKETKASISKPKKGYFLKLLDSIDKDKSSLPHILILDEINRVDLSRLFGELFSAIENHNEAIDLPVSFDGQKKNASVCIPDNLYIIGTMNEIDFSLERVDFALRRRFLWIFKGYDEETLKEMLSTQDSDADYLQFSKNCTALNKKIANESQLGKQYEIGHAIFAEIIKIKQELSDGKEENAILTAQNILWQISIEPLLEAYLGSIDDDERKNLIDKFAQAFGIEVNNKNNEDGEAEND